MIESDYIVVGCGIFGAVLAERIASVLQKDVTIVEQRSHIGGNCFSSEDPETGIECHRYGSHIFHTSSKRVWKYINQFSSFTNYRHKVITLSGGQFYYMPINLKTLCDVYHKALTPSDAEKTVQSNIKIEHTMQNLEEKTVSLIGSELYEKFIRGYTRKQWGKDPKELSADIINRLPVRTDFNTDYFNDPYQGIPEKGYSALFEHLLSNPRIHLLLNTPFTQVRSSIPQNTYVIYTGMIDRYFDCSLGKLEWRALRFEWETVPVRDYQGTSVVNYADENVPFTRIHEFKHYHPEWTESFLGGRTVICREYPLQWEPGMEACYPVNTERNRKLLNEYTELAQRIPNLIFGGRLGCYQYWNMDQTVEKALECFDSQIMRH